MSKPITIPIKKHTRVRRPMSKFVLDAMGFPTLGVTHNITSIGLVPAVVVQDIKTDLEEPLIISEAVTPAWSPKDFSRMAQNINNAFAKLEEPKPNWLTRIKRIGKKR